MDSQFLSFAALLFNKATVSSKPSSSGKAEDRAPASRWSQHLLNRPVPNLALCVFLLKDTLFSVFIGD